MNAERSEPILVTGAAGQLGAVGRTVTSLLLDRGLPVRALVRREDERAAAVRAAGAEVVGDQLDPADV
jgi:NAD(P)H dehydrogenase (quinone)